jgi:DNA-binding CsgD family transcriptional regulator
MTQFPQLSNREQEVIQHLLEGKSNKLIASSLGVSDRTVEFHLKNIYVKFEVSSRVELILKLGDSTVAGKAEVAENRDGLNLRNWATSLREAVSRIGKEFKMKNSSNSNARNEVSTMTFYESIRVCLTKYAEFNGQASRPEFWWFFLFIILIASALAYMSEILSSVFFIAVLLPLLAAGSRRLHDSGKSAWQLLYLLVPVAGIILLGFFWAEPSIDSLSEDDTLPA